MLTLTNISKRFGSVVAVDDLSLEIRRGEVFGLLGPNGAGKTTSLHIAVGLLRPDRGTVSLGDHGSPTAPAARQRLGVAPQALALYEELSGAENLSFFGALQGLAGGELQERVRWALDFVQLTERGRSRVSEYSGGMKRRLNLAVAMVHDPELLLLDEPTVAIDPQSRNAIFDRIVALKRLGRTIILTTHHMEEAERLCDRVGIIDHGRLLALDSVPNLVRAHGGRQRLFIRRGDEEQTIETDDPITEIARLSTAGPPDEFRVARPDLETVFLHLTGRQLRD